MLVDAKTLTESTTLSTDVCVVGAGPVGLTLAAELTRAGNEVTVLEAGGLPYDRGRLASLPKALRDHLFGAQSLTRGTVDGEPYFPMRLSRARGIGGTTNALRRHGLRSRPLDPIDFEDRLGVGWPISYADYARHLPAAARFCGLGGDAEAPTDDHWSYGSELDPDQVGDLVTVKLDYGPRDAFTADIGRIRSNPRLRLVTSAVVTGFRQKASPAVSEVEVTTLRGRRLLVSARMFVLALGGIDTPRLLLNAGRLMKDMGPAADSVGRYFMEHLHYVPGYLQPSSARSADLLCTYLAGRRRAFTLRDEVVRELGLPRAALEGEAVYVESLDPGVAAAGSLMRILPYGPFAIRPRLRQAACAIRGIRRVAGVTTARLKPSRSKGAFALLAMVEQAPLRDSRVTLSTKRDKTGLPLAALNWRVDGDNFRAMQTTMEILGQTMLKLDLGDVVSLWDQEETRPIIVTGGWHHMGTTRMSRRPEGGVVDENCRVHGIPNLYVAGSSVFPTGGFANPTLSAVALAIRLSAHISSEISARP